MPKLTQFNPDLEEGQILTNKEIMNIFKCACEGGIRYSSKTQTIILIDSQNLASGHDGKLDYIGQGKNGDQQLTRMNKRLYDFLTNKKDVFLFEVKAKGTYIFKGPVHLYAQPFQKEITEENRKVWVFPIELIPAQKDTPL